MEEVFKNLIQHIIIKTDLYPIDEEIEDWMNYAWDL
jgi:hypothetical protein